MVAPHLKSTFTPQQKQFHRVSTSRIIAAPPLRSTFARLQQKHVHLLCVYVCGIMSYWSAGEEDVYGETLRYTYFDVKYLLGGSEKGVKETFITCTPLETAARQSAPREIFTVEVPEV